MAEKLDFKKAYRDLYLPKAVPSVIEVPPMLFLMTDGQGDPNDPEGAYQKAVEALYAVSYTVKMSKMSGLRPPGYIDYVVPPLEGLWWLEDHVGFDLSRKELYCWTAMIRQPDFVTTRVFDWAKETLARKKPHLNTSGLRLETFQEGLCVQMLHVGPYDLEPASIAIMDRFVAENGYLCALGDPLGEDGFRTHHEIYLGDPRKTSPEKLKTVLRHPIKPA